MDKKYKIVRFFNDTIDSDKSPRNRVMARNLTLKQAQEWCNDPETSSKTAIKNANKYRKRLQWFDGYTEQ